MTGRRARDEHAAPVEVVRPALVQSGDVPTSYARGVPSQKRNGFAEAQRAESGVPEWIPETWTPENSMMSACEELPL
jgi:hypothetical protein